MGAVKKALQDYKVGKNTEEYKSLAENLALMTKRYGVGIDINKFSDMSATGRTQALANVVESQRGTPKYQGMLDLAEEIMPELQT